jgi:hypothetical protein
MAIPSRSKPGTVAEYLARRATRLKQDREDEQFDDGPDGKLQCMLPGAERASLATVAKRRANAPLRPKTVQKPCDVGLFSDDADQLDLVEMFMDSTEEE